MSTAPAVPTIAATQPTSIASRDFDLLHDLVTEREFAAFMGRDVKSIRRWNTLGIGPPRITFQRKTCLYRKESIITWLASLEKGGLRAARRMSLREGRARTEKARRALAAKQRAKN